MADQLTKEQRSKLMSSVRQAKTSLELLVSAELTRRQCCHSTNVGGLPGRPDIVIEQAKVAVFVHGCYWHGHSCRAGRLAGSNIEYWSQKVSENRARDRRKVYALRKAGWRVATVWGCRLKKPSNVVREIDRILRLTSVRH
jgi:DNA mismatch endonuclease, patch repair protein